MAEQAMSNINLKAGRIACTQNIAPAALSGKQPSFRVKGTLLEGQTKVNAKT